MRGVLQVMEFLVMKSRGIDCFLIPKLRKVMCWSAKYRRAIHENGLEFDLVKNWVVTLGAKSNKLCTAHGGHLYYSLHYYI